MRTTKSLFQEIQLRAEKWLLRRRLRKITKDVRKEMRQFLILISDGYNPQCELIHRDNISTAYP
jgi:hypothetical protein